MKIVHVSNFINHHQIALSNALQKHSGDFTFLQTQEMTKERVQAGWQVDESTFPWLVDYRKEPERGRQLLQESDVVIFGWNQLPRTLIDERLSSGKLSFVASERLYREGQWKAISPRGLLAKGREHFRYRKMPVYLLCAGAYVASDFHLIHCYPHKMLRWGYFPEVFLSEEETVHGQEGTADREDGCAQRADATGDRPSPVSLLFAGRFVPLKHPEFALSAASLLKERGIPYTLTMTGDGPLRSFLEAESKRRELNPAVRFTGTLKPEEVRREMGRTDLFLFPSNYLEGWGAVVNEAMGNGCTVIASSEAGAVPYLIRDHENGLVFGKGKKRAFCERVLEAANDRSLREQLSLAARTEIATKWNAEEAAKRFVLFCKKSGWETGREAEDFFHDGGPMTPAPLLRPPAFLRTLQEVNHLQW